MSSGGGMFGSGGVPARATTLQASPAVVGVGAACARPIDAPNATASTTVLVQTASAVMVITPNSQGRRVGEFAMVVTGTSGRADILLLEEIGGNGLGIAARLRLRLRHGPSVGAHDHEVGGGVRARSASGIFAAVVGDGARRPGCGRRNDGQGGCKRSRRGVGRIRGARRVGLDQ